MKRQSRLKRLQSRYRGVGPSNAKASARLQHIARSSPVVLAAVIALRALVPVGYMLSLPGDGSLDWALHLCPVQNRSLDVAAFQSAAGGEHHGHAGAGATGSAGERTHLTVSGECTAWLDSATPALAASISVPDLHDPAAAAPVDPDPLLTGRLRRHPAQPRAPPATV